MVRLEVEIRDFTTMRSRIVWPESVGPWIVGGVDELMVHFTYAGWSAYKTGNPISLVLTSTVEELGIAVAEMLSRTIQSMGAVQVSEVRMNKEALDAMKRDRIDP